MKIVFASDSFKGNLSSLQVANALERGVRRVLPTANCIKVPMADGGEGMVRSLVGATTGRLLRKTVMGPLGENVKACYGLLGDEVTAVLEVAESSGLTLLPDDQRNPLKTTSYGLGELILEALRRKVDNIIIGLGGSATQDMGMGMAQALGVRFLDKRGRIIDQVGCGGLLGKIAKIDVTGLEPNVRRARITIASDVRNPLCGKHGASYVFGPQKGATPAMVRHLDTSFRDYARCIKRDLDRDIINVEGGGAAGGLGAALLAFTKARMKRGVDVVMAAMDFGARIKDADLVITGEGCIDRQTPFGKAPAGVAKMAAKYRIPVVAIGGSISDDAHAVFHHRIDGLESACARDMDLEEAIHHSRAHLANAAERAIRLILIGKKMVIRQQKKKGKRANRSK